MEISVGEAAQLLNRSPRAIRYLVKQGQISARRVGRSFMIRLEELPLTDVQRQEAAKTWERVRETVDRVLPPAPPTAPGPAPAARPQPGQEPSRTYSLKSLRTFTAGIELCGGLLSVPDGFAAQVYAGRLDPVATLITGLESLANAFYQYDPRRKRESLEDARRDFSRALTRLFALRHIMLHPATGLPLATPDGPTAAGGDQLLMAQVDRAIEGLESEVMPGLTGLLRRIDGKRQGGGGAAHANEERSIR